MVSSSSSHGFRGSTLAFTTTRRIRLSLYGLSVAVFLFVSHAHIHRPGLERTIDPNDATGSSYINYNDPSRCTGPYESLVQKYTTFGKRWIVVTTINQPTDAMELLCNLPGWNVSATTPL